MTTNWFAKGEAGYKQKAVIDEMNSIKREKNIRRFWLKEKEESKIMFLDTEAFYCSIHQIKFKDSWNNFITCTDEFKPCPLCEDGKTATFVGHYSIIEFKPYVNKKGETVEYSKCLFPAKSSTIEILYDLAKKYKNLTYLIFKVKRYKDAPNCGGTFELLGKMKDTQLSSFKKEVLLPFDYEKILAPPTDAELRAYGYAPFKSRVGNENAFTDKDINSMEDLNIEEMQEGINEISIEDDTENTMEDNAEDNLKSNIENFNIPMNTKSRKKTSNRDIEITDDENIEL